MIASDEEERILRVLIDLYSEAASKTDPNYQNFYSKLAVLEVCGWTEACMDGIVREHISSRVLTMPENNKFVNEIIEKNHGFSYHRHFRKMLRQIIGIFELERLEEMLPAQIMGKLVAALNYMVEERNSLAHRAIGSTPKIASPSLCVEKFQDIHNGLLELERKIQTL